MRVAAIILSIFVLLIAGALLVPSFINWNNYKTQIIEQVETATGFDAEISGDISLAVLPVPHAIVNGLSLKHPNEDVQMLQLDSADVYVAIMPLLSGNIALESITLNAPKIALRKFKDGSVNWMTDVLKGDGAATEEPAATSSVSIDSLSIENGQLSYTDEATGTVQDVKDVNATFSMGSLQGPFDLDADLNAMGFPLIVKVKSEAINKDNNTLPLNAEVALADNSATAAFSGIVGMGEKMDVQGDTKLAVSKLRDFVKALTKQDNPNIPNTPLNANGMLSVSATEAHYANLNLRFDGMDLNGPFRIKGLDQAPMMITTDLINGQERIKGDVSFEGRAIRFANVSLIYAGSNLKLDGSWTAPASTAGRGMLDVKLQSGIMDVDTLSEKFGIKAGGGKPTPVKEMGKSLILPFDMDLTATIDKLIVQKMTYDDLYFSGALKQNQLKITDASAKKYLDADASLRGTIANLENLSGLDLVVTVKAPNLNSTIERYNADNPKKIEVPVNIGALNATAGIKGNLDRLAFDAKADTMNAVITGAGTVSDPLDKMAMSGLSLGIKHPDLNAFMKALYNNPENNPALAKPVDLSARIDMKDNVYTLNDIKGSFGPMQMSGNIIAETGGPVPSVKGALNLGNLPLESFLPETEGNSKSTQSAVRWNRDTIDTAFLHSLESDLAISAGKVTYGAWNFEQPSFKFRMNNGTLSVDEFRSGLFGGTAKVDIVVSAKPGNNQPLSIQTTANLDKVGLQSLVTALAGSAIVKSNGVVDFDTSLNTSGANMAAIVSSLSGKGTVNGNDITIQGIDIADLSRSLTDGGSLGNQAKALFKSGIQGGATTFDTMAGAFTVNGGIVTFDPLTLTGAKAVMTTTGNVSLPAWTVDMKSIVQLTEPADAPPLEMAFRGSLDNPGQSIAQNAIESYLNQKLSNKVNKLLEKKLGDKMDGELGGVIGGLLGVQKPQTQVPAPVNPNAPPPDVPPPGAEPAAGTQQQQPPANQNEQKPGKVEVEDVAKDLLKGLF